MRIVNSVMEPILSSRLSAIVLKETREILRNKYLIFLILVPPVVQLLILGAAIDPQVRKLSMAVVDHARTEDSRRLIDKLEATGLFSKTEYASDEDKLERQLEKSQKDVAIVIPSDFSKQIAEGKTAKVQVLIDGTNAYVAGIASAYVLRTINQFEPPHTSPSEKEKPTKNSINKQAGEVDERPGADLIDPRANILYNPGQYSSWAFLPGILGATLTLTGTLVAAATVLRERESGTMEQLLMTPARTWEILFAKLIPLVVFLLADVCLAVAAAYLIFGMPCRGSLLLLLSASAMYIFVAIGVGMMLGSIYQTQRQAQLASFFINIPLILLSGTVVPLDTMPPFLQSISLFDPLRYYAFLNRSIILKGDTLAMLWPQMLALALFALAVLLVSTQRFKRQLI